MPTTSTATAAARRPQGGAKEAKEAKEAEAKEAEAKEATVVGHPEATKAGRPQGEAKEAKEAKEARRQPQGHLTLTLWHNKSLWP